MMKRILSIAIIASIFIAGLGAQANVEPFSIASPRMAALGGAHAASVNGVDAIFENPAGFASDKSEISVSSIVLSPSGPIFDIVGLLLEGGDAISGLPNLFDEQGRLYVNAGIMGPLAFAYAGKGLGFGIYNKSSVLLNASSIFSVKYSVSEEILLTGGYAYRLPLPKKQILDLGLMAKGFIRANMGKTASLSELIDLMSDPAAILGSPMSMTTSLGFDAGLIWDYDNLISLGLVMRDTYSPAMISSYDNFTEFMDNPGSGTQKWSIVRPDLALGLAYKPRFEFLSLIGAQALLLLDYVDIIDLFSVLPRNPVLNVRLGLELQLLDILSLRAGINDALPAAGFGIDLQAFTFSLAMYGKELGKEPGARPLFNMTAGFEFRY